MKETNVNDEFFNVYGKLLDEYLDYHKETYIKLFEDLSEKHLNEIYKNYCLFTKKPLSFVYFIYNKYTKLIKIGCSNDPLKRLDQISSLFKNNFGVDDGLELIGIKYIHSGKMTIAEKKYHKQYSNYRKFGEWFNVSKKSIQTDCLIGDISLNYSIKVDYDTDNFLENEGFKLIKYIMPPDYIIYKFVIDTLISNKKDDDDLYKVKDVLYKYINDKFAENNQSVVIGKLFNNPYENEAWSIYEWLYMNKCNYALTSIPRYDFNTGKTNCKVVQIGNPKTIIYYNETLENIVHEYLGINFNSSLHLPDECEVATNA